MSAFMTLAGEDYLLNLLSGARAPVPILYVALIAGQQPTRFGSADELDEIAAGGYTRVGYANHAGSWTIPLSGEMYNVNPVQWQVAEEDWPTINYWAICDDETSGTVLWAGTFSDAVNVVQGDQLEILQSGLCIRISDDTLKVNL